MILIAPLLVNVITLSATAFVRAPRPQRTVHASLTSIALPKTMMVATRPMALNGCASPCLRNHWAFSDARARRGLKLKMPDSFGSFGSTEQLQVVRRGCFGASAEKEIPAALKEKKLRKRFPGLPGVYEVL
jgi:hypothetical protein